MEYNIINFIFDVPDFPKILVIQAEVSEVGVHRFLI